MTARSDKPFARWRAHGYKRVGLGEDRIDHMTDDGAVPFDECSISLGKESCVHLEVMNDRDLFVGLGAILMNVHVDKDGAVSVRLIEGTVGADGLIR